MVCVVDEVEGRDPLSMTKQTMKIEKTFSSFYEKTSEMSQAMKNVVKKIKDCLQEQKTSLENFKNYDSMKQHNQDIETEFSDIHPSSSTATILASLLLGLTLVMIIEFCVMLNKSSKWDASSSKFITNIWIYA